MADSDNSTTLPFVTRGDEIKSQTLSSMEGLRDTSRDPAVMLAIKWTEAHAKTQALCIQQQQHEIRLADAVDGRDHDLRDRHTDAIREENLAADVEQTLLDSLPLTPALTVSGIVGKLKMILGECEDNTDIAEFPGPHIRSVLADLEHIADQRNAYAAWAAYAAWCAADEKQYRFWVEMLKRNN
ncbi:hypothetical protein [Mesorhizobium sp. INR15]|uniref:hypothetical protein n=1 Tax=Mesorhizobium sp. INR15 TaxID=2654248 RepID=UPI00189694A5|nr:hypothetical protein [Mesorhizobium sp. INR15]QPC94728.1 hypothetical protein GA829_31315 [Mesorhizobium sp. INR15]